MIGIAIAAVGIPKEIIRRCYQSLADARIAVPYRVHIQTTCEGKFSRSSARNQAILALLPYCDKIVCLDVDCLVPPGLIEYAAEHIRDGQAVWALVRKVPSFDGRYVWDEWRAIPPWPWGTGAFIGMTSADWLLVGGWDERIITWGGEDDVLALRRKERGIRTLMVSDYPLVHIEHEYRGRNIQQGRENRQLGSTPPPRNFLAGRLPIAMHRHTLFLWCTARCQSNCPRCSQRALMQFAPDYEMTLEEIDLLIDAVRQSNYPPFRKIVVTGGESLLWSHLAEGLRRLAEANLGPIQLFTNGLAIERADLASPYVDEFRVSAYTWNRQAVKEFQSRYGAKVRVRDARTHWLLPLGPRGEETLPPSCVGPGYLVYDRHVYTCCNSPAIPMALGTPIEEVPRCRLQPGFIEALLPLQRQMEWYCRACIGNQKIQPWLS